MGRPRTKSQMSIGSASDRHRSYASPNVMTRSRAGCSTRRSVKSHRAPESSIRYAISGSVSSGLIGTGTTAARNAPIVVSSDSTRFADNTAMRSPSSRSPALRKPARARWRSSSSA
jgi:hypothetical protein